MRKLALLADLHGNSVATKAIEKALTEEKPDEIWCLGDCVGKGPESAFTCDWVKANCSVVIAGNWDLGISQKQFNDQYYWNQLGEQRMEWLKGLPLECEMFMSGIRFRLFHGRPVTELMNVHTSAERLESVFKTKKGKFGGVIFADSHRPFIRTTDMGYYVNTGSVGNSIGIPNAHCLIMEGEMGENTPTQLKMTVLCVPYNNDAAADIARNDIFLPHQDAYINEILTGEYSR